MKINNESEGWAAIQGKRILVVDDNVPYLDAAKFLIEAGDAIVSSARNGKEAIDLLRQESFDCVLMDIQMPVMDGIEAIRQIRADPAIAHVRVVAMTGNVERYTREKCISAGMDDFISKPFRIQDLCDKLGEP